MKKFVLFLIVAILLMSSAAAAEIPNISVFRATDNDEIVQISGSSPALTAGKLITVTVLKHGVRIEDIQDYGSSVIARLSAVLNGYAESGGRFSILWEPAENGEYDIYVAGLGMETSLKTYFFANKDDILKLSQEVTTAGEQGMSEIFSDDINCKMLGLDLTEYARVSQKTEIGKILWAIRGGLDNKNLILDYFSLACKLSRLYEEPTVQALDAVLGGVVAVGGKIDELNFYKTQPNSEVKTLIASRLQNKVKGSLTGFNDSFTEALVLSGIEKATNWTTVQSYMSLISNAKYEKNKDDIAEEITGKSFTSLEQLCDYIDSIKIKDGNGSGTGTGTGGKGASVKGSFTEAPLSPPVVNDEKKVLFTDMTDQHWAFESVNYLKWKGIINGDEAGKFWPDRFITRAELLKLLCETFGLNESAEQPFKDVSASSWYKPYVAAAYKNGLITGYDNLFCPDAEITREDMAVMFYRFSAKSGYAFDVVDSHFEDTSQISDYAIGAVDALYKAGIINGISEQQFLPKSFATRAQAAAIIYKAIKNEVIK